MSSAPDPRPQYIMTCDVPRCMHLVARAPRIRIPPQRVLAPDWLPIKMWTTLHYCLPHVESAPVDPRAVLTDEKKRMVELCARRTRPFGWRPDFERAAVEWVHVTTPEYRAFLNALGIDRVFTA